MRSKVSLSIRYRRRSDLALLPTLALLTTACLSYLAWGQHEVAASGPQAPLAMSIGVREYYLTTGFYNGGNASTACVSGYHMASLWEILNPSHLEYNTTLGFTLADSGAGPTHYPGWVRTGFTSENSNTVGRANCDAWSTTAGYGTRADLPDTWDAGWEDMHVWNVETDLCTTGYRVWCVED